jgi:hypothetical protein
MHAQSTNVGRAEEGDDFLQNPRGANSKQAVYDRAGTSTREAKIPTSVVTPPTPVKEVRKARPLSMMVRGWSYAGDNGKEKEKEKEAQSRQASASPEKGAQAVEEEVKAEKRVCPSSVMASKILARRWVYKLTYRPSEGSASIFALSALAPQPLRPRRQSRKG